MKNRHGSSTGYTGMHAIGWIGKAALISCDVSTSQPDIFWNESCLLSHKKYMDITHLFRSIYIHFHSKGHREYTLPRNLWYNLPSISVPLQRSHNNNIIPLNSQHSYIHNPVSTIPIPFTLPRAWGCLEATGMPISSDDDVRTPKSNHAECRPWSQRAGLASQAAFHDPSSKLALFDSLPRPKVKQKNIRS